MQGATQLQSQTSKIKGIFSWERVCHFGHPVEAMFEAEEDPGSTRWPLLTMKVCSVNVNGSEVCEGYTWTSLYQLCPGSKQSTLTTWKPQGETLYVVLAVVVPNKVMNSAASGIQRLAQLFRGGTTEVNSLESVGMPIQPKSVLSKYGLLTKPSGSVQVNYHTLCTLHSTNCCFLSKTDKNE